jgi:hypothetical protein
MGGFAAQRLPAKLGATLFGSQKRCSQSRIFRLKFSHKFGLSGEDIANLPPFPASSTLMQCVPEFKSLLAGAPSSMLSSV